MESSKANTALGRRSNIQTSEGFELYGSQCSLPVIAHLVADHACATWGIDAVVAATEAGFLEPFALVVVNGYLSQVRGHGPDPSPAVSISSSTILPLPASEEEGREPTDD
ncbi:MAG: hypothetical protein ACYTAN_09315 [Planctomycetota bacterium]